MKKLDSVRDVLKNTKHRRPTQIFCPRCGSPNIHLNSSLDVWLTPRQYYCENCGYLGILVMELEPEPENTKNASEKEKQEPNKQE